jgi:outer membrane protein OmpA-like peptidoglycan-associated protein
MSMKTPILLSFAALLGLTACVEPQYNAADPNARTRNGAIIGGVAGAIAGASGTNEDRLAKAVLGGAIGAGLGAAIGNSLDQQAADLNRSIVNPNISVTNYGDYLVVNMPQDLLFATDSSFVRPDLQGDLRAVGQNLVQYPNSRIEVIGHTDNSGSAAYNQQLSQDRAASVAAVLRGAGVPSARISTFGRGEDQPIASNLTPDGRAQNRRVEIVIRPTN